MTALAPTTAVIRAGQGDAHIVGVIPLGVTLTQVVLTATQDSRWDAAGCAFNCRGNGGVQDWMVDGWLEKRVPIKRGVTLTATQTGAGVGYCLVYVDYPDLGEPFSVRGFLDGVAQMTHRTATAGGALTANTISLNSTSITNFIEGRAYQLVGLDVVTGGTGPEICVGWTDPKTNMMVFFPVPITDVLASGVAHVQVPKGALKAMTRGETLYVHYVSAATDTPVVNFVFAHDAGK